jgi:hypothetical protein
MHNKRLIYLYKVFGRKIKASTGLVSMGLYNKRSLLISILLILFGKLINVISPKGPFLLALLQASINC